MSELNLDQLFQTYADEAAAKESNERKRRTVPTGSYILTGNYAQANVGDNERMARLYGRQYGRFGGGLTTKTGDKRGSTFFNASWEVRRINPDTKKGEAITDDNRERATNEKWPLDWESKLWGQLATTFEAVQKPVAEMFELFKMYPVSVFITESFATPEGYRSPKDDAERETYLKAGYEAYNNVVSIGKIR